MFPLSIDLYLSCQLLRKQLRHNYVKNLIEDHLLLNAPISPHQWGFMSTRSTISALIQVIDDWALALDQGFEVCVIIFDVKKAFDTVPHIPLLQKMHLLGLNFPTCYIRWVQSYLTGRLQYVGLVGYDSPTLPAVSGVPQASVLGPLLFILMMQLLLCLKEVRSICLQCV